MPPDLALRLTGSSFASCVSNADAASGGCERGDDDAVGHTGRASGSRGVSLSLSTSESAIIVCRHTQIHNVHIYTYMHLRAKRIDGLMCEKKHAQHCLRTPHRRHAFSSFTLLLLLLLLLLPLFRQNNQPIRTHATIITTTTTCSRTVTVNIIGVEVRGCVWGNERNHTPCPSPFHRQVRRRALSRFVPGLAPIRQTPPEKEAVARAGDAAA